VTTDDEAKANIAANLNRILAERKISQRALARLTNEPPMTINSVLNGRHIVSTGTITRIAEALDVSIDRLVGTPANEKNSRRTA